MARSEMILLGALSPTLGILNERPSLKRVIWQSKWQKMLMLCQGDRENEKS
jgi:hypothetical protein